jgi:hypothetical protein
VARDGRIVEIDILADPERLQRLYLTRLPGPPMSSSSGQSL